MTKWKFVLCRSTDLIDIAELTQARQRQLNMSLNNPGSLSFTIPLDDEFGQLIYPIEYAIKAYRVGTTGTRLIWSGYVNTIDENVTENKMTVNCVGWIERLNHFIVHRDDLQFTDWDDAEIVHRLIQAANNRIGSGKIEHDSGVTSTRYPDGTEFRWPAGSTPNTPTLLKSGWPGVPNEGPGGDTAYVEARRSVRYVKYQTNIGQAIKQLTEVENGLDIWVDPATRIVYMYRKKCRVLPEIVFGFGAGPNNLLNYSRQLDGSVLTNYMYVSGGAGSIPQAAIDEDSQDIYGPFEDTASISDRGGIEANDVLRYYAGAEVIFRSRPRVIHSITPFGFSPENSVPEPFVEYDIGDQVTFMAIHEPRIRTVQQVRIFGMSISIDEEDNERINSLQIYAQ